MPDINTPEPRQREDQNPVSVAEMPRHAGHHRLLWALSAILLVVAIAGGGSYWLMGQRQQHPLAVLPMKVPFIVVMGKTVPIYRSFPGTIQAIRSVTIQARVTGYLAKQGAPDGADVASGALLYRIDPKDYQAAFAQALASLRQASASLRYARVSQGRNQLLARDGWVSLDRFDQANSTLHEGEANLASDDASLQEAALNLSRTEISAPFAGRLSHSQAFTGSLITVAGAALNTLVQLDPIYVSFNPAEVNLVAIMREQERAPIQTAVFVDGGAPRHPGPLTFLDTQVSQSTGTILLRATIANPDRSLLPGEYVTARLHLGDLRNALLVPQSAVGSTQIGQTLLVVGKGDKVEERIVKLGDSEGDMVVVAHGLKPGDRVIIGQLQKLRPGAHVQPEKASPSST
jgi:membrane fusion protein, multidrug efflux system